LADTGLSATARGSCSVLHHQSLGDEVGGLSTRDLRNSARRPPEYSWGSHTPPKVSARVSLAFDPRRHFRTRASGRVESALGEVGGSLGGVGGRLFTDKLGFGWSEVLGVWSLDRAAPATPAYPAHASGSPAGIGGGFTWLISKRQAKGKDTLTGR
jgi:hypothetical protein